MSETKSLETARIIKRLFSVTDKKDIEIYRQYLLNKGWGKAACPFILEFPHLTIPNMISDKLIRKFLKV